MGRYPDLLLGFVDGGDRLCCRDRLSRCRSARAARQRRRAVQNAQAEGQRRREDSEFLFHFVVLL